MSDPDPKPTLEYDRSGNNHVTRGQFRLLLILIFINTIAIVTYLLLPTAPQLARQMWQEFQSARRARMQEQRNHEAERKRIEVIAKAMPELLAYEPPTTGPVYTEDAEEAAALLISGPAYQTIAVKSQRGMDWQAPVVLPATDAMRELPHLLRISTKEGSAAVVFVHARKNPAGADRLICCELRISAAAGEGSDEFIVQLDRALVARLIDPGAPGERPKLLHTIETAFDQRDSQRIVIKKNPRAGENRVTVPQLFRLFPGQADEKDPTRFTIPYQMNRMPSSFIGRVLDGDRLSFEPAEGRIVERRRSSPVTDEQTWEP